MLAVPPLIRQHKYFFTKKYVPCRLSELEGIVQLQCAPCRLYELDGFVQLQCVPCRLSFGLPTKDENLMTTYKTH